MLIVMLFIIVLRSHWFRANLHGVHWRQMKSGFVFFLVLCTLLILLGL